MARVPDEEIERLKREISVERLAEARGGEAPAARGEPRRASARSTRTGSRRW